MKRLALPLSGIVLAALLAGAGTLSAELTKDDPVNINIDNFSFTPDALKIPRGAAVTWTNRDDIPHTIVDASGQRLFKSGPLDTGDTFAHVFTKSGTYDYFCALHPQMRASVIVD
jgi:plastocyanin